MREDDGIEYDRAVRFNGDKFIFALPKKHIDGVNYVDVRHVEAILKITLINTILKVRMSMGLFKKIITARDENAYKDIECEIDLTGFRSSRRG